MRKIIDINSDWLFSKTTELPATLPTDWEKVNVPHTWNNEDGQDGDNFYHRGTCHYAKALKRPELDTNGRAIIEFEGVAMTATVYFNGTKVAYHEGGYSTFRADVTDHLQDENLLVVAVDNSSNDRVYPQKADFTFYGGIYRPVSIITVSDAHFELLGYGTPGIKVTPVVKDTKSAGTVEVQTWQNKGQVKYTITDANNKVVATSDANTEDGTSVVNFTVENPTLWDGLENPYLYTMTAELADESGKTVDSVSTRFGFRFFSFDSKTGFYLNGRSYPLRGVSRHQDFKGIGSALTNDLHDLDMAIIKEMGANTIRLAHYQHSQYFYDLCDEVGMVVWAEIPYITNHMPNGRQNTIDQMTDLVTQCYNHASIVTWGLSNEITAAGVTEDLVENHKILNDLCHKMDETRPTTMAHVFIQDIDDPIVHLSDIASYNVYYGWYVGECEDNDKFFDGFHEKYPDRVMGCSEYGADANAKFHSSTPEAGDHTVDYQMVYHEHLLNLFETRPYFWATHLWNMFDFAADARNEGGEHGLNQKGTVTFDRKYKKDTFFLYKAYWSNEPFVHVTRKGCVDRVEDTTEVKVYTNQKEVTLFVDGKEIETKKADRIVKFNVNITSIHKIEVKAGNLSDSSEIKKVAEPNKSYEGGKSDVINWFDNVEIDPNFLSLEDKVSDIVKIPEAIAMLSDLMKPEEGKESMMDGNGMGEMNEMMLNMPLKKLISLLAVGGIKVSEEQLNQLNRALQQIKK